MQLFILSMAVLSANAAPMPDAVTKESASVVLLANCIDTEFRIVAENDSYTIVECDGSWKPFQSGVTSYDVQRELRKAGVTAKPFEVNGSPLWKSGFHEFPKLKNGRKSVFSARVQGMTTAENTFVILFRK